MNTLRRSAPILKNLQLVQCFYLPKTFNATHTKMKQVHQETLRYICPYATIKVDSDIYLKVSSVDPHKYPSGDAFVAELHGDPVKNCTASMTIKVSDDERNVEVELRKLTESSEFHCELAVPVKASLDINALHAVVVNNTYGNELKVKANKFIGAKNVRAEKIELNCEGDIFCQELLLGKNTTMEAQKDGKIQLDKVQGDTIKCKTNQGDITTNCSYVELSEFRTNTGNLDLKNVHKKSAVYVEQKGNLKMTGFHGNLKVLINKGTMNLQLSVLEGENTIDVKDLTSCIINISDDIENSTNLDISLIEDKNTPIIRLKSSLAHLSSALSENKQQLKITDQKHSNKLKVVSKSSLDLGKSSWTDMMRLEMAQKQKD